MNLVALARELLLLTRRLHTKIQQDDEDEDDDDDAAISLRRRSVTALPRRGGGERTPAAHSTAFRRSTSRCLLALLAALLLAQTPPIRRSGALAGEAPPVSHNPRHHPYNEYTWELNQLNPWLSACDLAGPAPADLQGGCQGPHEPPKICPAECRRHSKSAPEFDEVIEAWARIERRKQGDDAGPAPKQCLFYLEDAHASAVCRADFGRASARAYASAHENRFWFLSGLRLKHCCEHAAVNALSPGRGGTLEAVLAGGEACRHVLDTIVQVDLLAARLQCEFDEVLVRYDCGQTYSVIHNCTHCKEAYRKWVCSSLVPYFAHGGPHDSEPTEESWVGRRIRPCRSLCQSVEQRCPYLLPGDRAPAYPTQYAGEPTFLCRDPNIPETGEQAARALHPTSEDECCFEGCNEKEPLLGNCANCSNSVVYMGPNPRDPPTAPQCDVAPVLPGPPPRRSPFCGPSSDANSNPEPPTESSSSSSSSSSPITEHQQQQQQPTSSAAPSTTATTTAIPNPPANGGTTSPNVAASSASSSSAASTASASLPLVCLFWLWGVLFSSQCSSPLVVVAVYRHVQRLVARVAAVAPRVRTDVVVVARHRKLVATAVIVRARPRAQSHWRCFCWRGHCWRHWRWLWPCRWKKRKSAARSRSWSREPS